MLTVSQKNFYLNTSGILFVNDFFHGSGYKYVARLIHEVLSLIRLGPGETDDGTVFYAILLQFLRVERKISISNAVSSMRLVIDKKCDKAYLFTLGSMPSGFTMEPSCSITPMQAAPARCK